MALLILIIFLICAYNMDKTIKELQKENQELKSKIANLIELKTINVSEREVQENNLQVKICKI